MREIKFRAWYGNEIKGDEEAKRLLYNGCAKAKIFHTDAVIMQFTGLKNKNGVEIFEGDICQRLESENSVVLSRCKIIYKQGGFALEWITKSWFNDSIRSHYEDLEVIGNIYQHSHLLSNGKQ